MISSLNALEEIMSTVEQLKSVLCEIGHQSGVEAAALVSKDGLVIADNMPSGIRAEVFAAMSATLLGAAVTMFEDLGKDDPSRVMVDVQDSHLIAIGVGGNALLVTMAGPEVGLGVLLMEMEKAVERIKQILY